MEVAADCEVGTTGAGETASVSDLVSDPQELLAVMAMLVVPLTIGAPKIAGEEKERPPGNELVE